MRWAQKALELHWRNLANTIEPFVCVAAMPPYVK